MSSESPIDWAALQAFAAEQLRLEKSGAASKLTPAQRAAIATIIPAKATTSPTPSTDALLDENVNYIGLLNGTSPPPPLFADVLY